MREEYSRTDLGAIKIHKSVIASIASLAASEIDGIGAIGTSNRGIWEEVFGKRHPSGIRVEITKYEEVVVDVPVSVKYGYNIPDVASRVQEAVRQALEKMTNVAIKDINVRVQGVERG